MELTQRADAFSALGQWMEHCTEEQLAPAIYQAHQENQWFTPSHILQAAHSIGQSLQPKKMQHWLALYPELASQPEAKKVGIIMAGNIPLVGFQDLLNVLMWGHHAIVKMSSSDQKLLPFILQKLYSIEPRFEGSIVLADKLAGFDAAIATGSNNTARHFEYYLRHVPHLIRNNRSSAAILSGHETVKEMKDLGKDIFSYYGLGCRNVSKLYLPENFDIGWFYEPLQSFEDIGNHNKYANNHAYQKALHLMNLMEIYDNDFLLLKKEEAISSPVSVVYYETYTDLDSVIKSLADKAPELQCVATNIAEASASLVNVAIPSVALGKTQSPELWDYADGVDTMQWLMQLK
jgi:hypothetical protein